ncbi:MAG: hypothetical protein KDK89_00260 [Alphaproteobacteria bacterium]|nr:hypothetical protein [Alphaproteobacteria bacterium]
MRISFLTIGLILLLPAAAGAAVKVVADVRRQSDLAYGQILADAARAGRIYSREAAASGARRHYTEFLARQVVRAGDVALVVPEVIPDP